LGYEGSIALARQNVENIAAARTDDKIRTLNAATQAAVATFHRNLDQSVEKQRAVDLLTDRRLAAIETTQVAILEALNALPNQIASVFNALYAANPRMRIPPPAAPPAENLPPPAAPPPAAQNREQTQTTAAPPPPPPAAARVADQVSG
jgi:hypothetical protein